jgi:hypothetical protein
MMLYRYRNFLRIAAPVFTILLALAPSSATPAPVGSQASGDASATVVQPLSINVINPFLVFGKAASSGSDGTIVVTANAGSSSRSSTGGASIISSPFGAAVFFISGETGSPVNVVLPGSILVNSGANSMTVDSFQSSPPSPYNQPASGQFLSVGGTLHVAANQPPGSYAGTFNVSVNY